jgi:hypothetical protein
MTDTPWSGEAKCKALQAMERYREEAREGQEAKRCRDAAARFG